MIGQFRRSSGGGGGGSDFDSSDTTPWSDASASTVGLSQFRKRGSGETTTAVGPDTGESGYDTPQAIIDARKEVAKAEKNSGGGAWYTGPDPFNLGGNSGNGKSGGNSGGNSGSGAWYNGPDPFNLKGTVENQKQKVRDATQTFNTGIPNPTKPPGPNNSGGDSGRTIPGLPVPIPWNKMPNMPKIPIPKNPFPERFGGTVTTVAVAGVIAFAVSKLLGGSK